MRRTNKRHKKQNNIKKRKTLKKRFSKKGGVQKKCEICESYFHMKGTLGAPKESTINNVLFEDHIQTHPICAYCGEQVINNTELIKHIFKNHKEQYNIAKDMKDNTRFNSPSIIDDLASGQITLTKFYERIQNKIDKDAKKAKEANEKAIKAEEKVRLEEAKKLAKETARLEEEARKLKKIQKAKEEEEANKLAKEAIRERERVARETAAAKKLEQIKKEQQEKLARELEVKTMGMEDRVAKGIEKQNRKELASMGAEDIDVPELKQQLIEATTVEQVEEIIDNASNINESNQPTISKQEPINIEQLIAEELNNLNFVNFIEFFKAINTLYPAMTVFNSNVKYINPYKNINYGILFIVGVINNKLDELRINLKLVLKGGKAAQMILSENNIKKQNLIRSNDVDILLIQDGIYDYEFLLNFASQLADLIQKFFKNNISTIKPPNKILENQNIVKISYKYLDLEINPKTGLTYSGLSINPNLIPTDFDYTYIPLSDIDFKEVNVGNDFFSPKNIVSSSSRWRIQNGYIFNLLYYHQDLNTFIAEKEYYMSIYSNIIQQIPDSKPGNPGCNCSLPNDDNNECKKICRYRDLMLEKFNKYIEPLKNLIV